MSSPRLSMRGIERRFGPTVALAGVDLDVAPGEVHALLGENGAGKSTLMKILAGALAPDAGTMRLDGSPYRPARPLAARAAGVSMVYQELSLAPHLSVQDNILLGVEPAGALGIVHRTDAHRRVDAALARLTGARQTSQLHPETRVADLSPAARQLVEIARALAVEARVLVLDEPTSSLTAADTQRLFEVIRRLRDDGLCVIYISHFLEEVRQVADRWTVLRDGRAVAVGDVASTSAEEWVGHMVGRRLDDLYPRSPRQPGEAVLSVRGLHAPPAVETADFDLHRGEVLGIAGLLGAGRTRLLRALFGLDAVAGGQVRLAGAILDDTDPARSLAHGVGLLSEDRAGEGLATARSLTDNITLPRLESRHGVISPSRLRQRAAGWIERLGIRARGPEQPVRDLSGGNQQKVALARLLHADVDVWLLDEPTRGVDVASKAEIYRLVDDLATQGKAILWVSSYLPELLGVADRIAVMRRGLLGPARPATEWDEHALLLEATGVAA